MKILQVNKFYYPRGGAEKYFIEISKKLEKSGHDVRIFSMDHPQNLDTPDKKYFVSNISFNEKGSIAAWRSFFRVLYSFEAKRKFESLLQDFQPDIIHVHNIYHQISPSILSAARARNIPVIMHLHDYKLICPNYKLFNKKKVCTKCKGKRYYQCALNKCVKNSFPKSLLATLEMYLHHNVLNIYKKGIKLFIAPSQFMKKSCEEFGWNGEGIGVLTNFFTNTSTVSNKIEKNYLLYFGRLSEEKGIDILIRSLIGTKNILKIAGEGPERMTLENLSVELGLERQIDFVGFQKGSELNRLIDEAKAIIIPSIWFENMPLNLLEAMARGKIVIASEIGGIPEIIKDKNNGFLFKAGNSDELRKKILALDSVNKEKIKSAAAKTVIDFNINNHYEKLLKIYQEVLSK